MPDPVEVERVVEDIRLFLKGVPAETEVAAVADVFAILIACHPELTAIVNVACVRELLKGNPDG